MQMIGRTDGENAVKAGEGFLFSKFDEWLQSPDLQAQFPKIGDYVQHHNLKLKKDMKKARMHEEAGQDWIRGPAEEIVQ
jgi:hypothetical protein